MMWYPTLAAFRAGTAVGTSWDDISVGLDSVAFGNGTIARGIGSFAAGMGAAAFGRSSAALGFGAAADGDASLAVGNFAWARGPASVATGGGTVASGPNSTALGANTTASGPSSTALGEFSVASGIGSLAGGSATAAGYASLAFGPLTIAAGKSSVALGSSARTVAAAEGSFVFADASSINQFTSFAKNQFIVRAAGGLGVYTNAATTTGAEMAPGGGAWAALSDATMKENFKDIDGEDVLARLARVPVREWNYTSQDASVRHVGPTAQDFRAAFGLGEFERRITSTDADGVALAGVKALDARTQALRDRIADLERGLAEALAALRAQRGGGH